MHTYVPSTVSLSQHEAKFGFKILGVIEGMVQGLVLRVPSHYAVVEHDVLRIDALLIEDHKLAVRADRRLPVGQHRVIPATQQFFGVESPALSFRV